MVDTSVKLKARGIYQDLPFTVSRRNYLWRRAVFRGRNDLFRYQYSKRLLRRLASKDVESWTRRESRDQARAVWFLQTAPSRQCMLQDAGMCNGLGDCPFHHTFSPSSSSSDSSVSEDFISSDQSSKPPAGVRIAGNGA